MTDKKPKLAILAGEFNRPLVDAMIKAARDEARLSNAEVTRMVTVPGCYEVPLLARRLIALADVDALVVLGFVERGETLHGEVMGHVVHGALMELSLAHEKPVGLGIIGPGATNEQAEVRKDGYARAAVKAALAALAELRALP